jgi:hypothetical protein
MTTSTNIATSSEIAPPKMTNQTPGRTRWWGSLAELATAVMIGEPTASATTPPRNARGIDSDSPRSRRTPNAYSQIVPVTPITNAGITSTAMTGAQSNPAP